MTVVLVLALLVGTFATVMARCALSERQSHLHHQAIAVLQSGIDAAADFDFSQRKIVRLPLDDGPGRWVEVESVVGPDEQVQLVATLYRNDQPGLSIRRRLRSDR